VVGIGIALPFTPLAVDLGFTPLPALYFLFLAGMTIIYLLLVELVRAPPDATAFQLSAEKPTAMWAS